MAYGLNPQLYLEDGPAVQAGRAARFRSARSFAAWRTLDADDRLAVIARAMRRPSNDNPRDTFPIAL